MDWLNTPFSHATTGLGFVGADMTLRVEVSGLAEGDVAKVAAGFEQLGEQLTDSLAEQELEFLFEVIQGTTSLAINANMLSLQAWVEKQLEATIEEGTKIIEAQAAEGVGEGQ